jgi:hypothetical protein
MMLMTMNMAAADKTSSPSSSTPSPVTKTTPVTSSPPSSSPDMDLLEFLGSVETEGNSGQEVLTAIDTGLLPDAPEEPTHDAH